MQVAFAPHFFDSVAQLGPQAARVLGFLTAFQENPKQPGISLERLHHHDTLWSGRVSSDLRVIMHREGDLTLMLHADHHDAAYRWAERRKAERHPVTGVFQVVETIETVREVVREVSHAPALFAAYEDAYLLSLGTPPDYLPLLREVRSDDTLLEVLEHLPEDVGERLLLVAAGELVVPPRTPAEGGSRIYILEDLADLDRLLAAPLEKWLAFLHPTQEKLARGEFKGPVKVTGSAGTGKTVVAMHRARHLARQGKRVLFTTFVSTLAQNVERNLRLLCSPEELALIAVSTVHSEASDLARQIYPRLRGVPNEEIHKRIEQVAREGSAFSPDFLNAEHDRVIAPQGIRTWEEYRSARRAGRGRALSARDRKAAWAVFERVFQNLDADDIDSFSGVCRRALQGLSEGKLTSPYDAVVVDELQDLAPQELRLLSALAGAQLMLVGDAGQRIYGGWFSLNELGIKTQGRSHILRVNYRTTEQIRRYADQIAGELSDDFDGGQESRKGTRSLLRGPLPEVIPCSSETEQLATLVDRLQRCRRQGLAWADMAVFVRTNKLADEVCAQLAKAEVPTVRLEKFKDKPAVRVGTMHRAKGLEFKSVFLPYAQDRVIPLASVAERIQDPADREDFLAGERRLLYVSLTRARDTACILHVGSPSPFLPPALVAAP